MNLYISVEMLKERLTENKLFNLCPAVADPQLNDFLLQVISRAQSMAESYIAQCCKLPLHQVSPLVQEWILALAEYELCKRGPSSKVPEKIRTAYEDTLSQLRDLSEDRLVLPGEELLRKKINSSLEICTPPDRCGF